MKENVKMGRTTEDVRIESLFSYFLGDFSPPCKGTNIDKKTLSIINNLFQQFIMQPTARVHLWSHVIHLYLYSISGSKRVVDELTVRGCLQVDQSECSFSFSFCL